MATKTITRAAAEELMRKFEEALEARGAWSPVGSKGVRSLHYGDASVAWSLTTGNVGTYDDWCLNVNIKTWGTRRRKGKSYRTLAPLLRELDKALGDQKEKLDRDDRNAMDEALRRFTLGWCAERSGFTLVTEASVMRRVGVMLTTSKGDEKMFYPVSYNAANDVLTITLQLGETGKVILPLEQAKVIVSCINPINT